eukprot:CFRG4899T1
MTRTRRGPRTRANSNINQDVRSLLPTDENVSPKNRSSAVNVRFQAKRVTRSSVRSIQGPLRRSESKTVRNGGRENIKNVQNTSTSTNDGLNGLCNEGSSGDAISDEYIPTSDSFNSSTDELMVEKGIDCENMESNEDAEYRNFVVSMASGHVCSRPNSRKRKTNIGTDCTSSKRSLINVGSRHCPKKSRVNASPCRSTIIRKRERKLRKRSDLPKFASPPNVNQVHVGLSSPLVDAMDSPVRNTRSRTKLRSQLQLKTSTDIYSSAAKTIDIRELFPESTSSEEPISPSAHMTPPFASKTHYRNPYRHGLVSSSKRPYNVMPETSRYNMDKESSGGSDSLSDFIAPESEESGIESELDKPIVSDESSDSECVQLWKPRSVSVIQMSPRPPRTHFISASRRIEDTDDEDVRDDDSSEDSDVNLSSARKKSTIKKRLIEDSGTDESDPEGILPQRETNNDDKSKETMYSNDANERSHEKATPTMVLRKQHDGEKKDLTHRVAKGERGVEEQFNELYSDDSNGPYMIFESGQIEVEHDDDFIVSDNELDDEHEKRRTERRQKLRKQRVQKYNKSQLVQNQLAHGTLTPDSNQNAIQSTTLRFRARKTLALYKQISFIEMNIEKIDFSQIDLRWQNPKEDDKSLLHRAAECGNDDIIDALLNHGASPNMMDSNGMVPLVYALENDHYSAIERLFSVTQLESIMYERIFHKDQQTEMSYYSYIVHSMVRAHFIEGVKKLLQLNHKHRRTARNILNLRDQRGLTALAEAALSKSFKIMKLLLKEQDNHVRKDETDGKGATLLHTAAAGGSVDCFKEAIKVLGGGAYSLLKLEDEDMQTPVMYAAEHGALEVLKYIVQLTSYNALRCKDKEGKTPMHMAAIVGNTECVKFLIDNLHPVDVVDHNGWPPILYADWGASEDCISLLFEAGPSQIDRLETLWKSSYLDSSGEHCSENYSYDIDSIESSTRYGSNGGWDKCVQCASNTDQRPPSETARKTQEVIRKVFSFIANVPRFYNLLNSHIREDPRLLDEMYGFLLQKQSSLFDLHNKKTWLKRQLQKLDSSMEFDHMPRIPIAVERNNVLESALSRCSLDTVVQPMRLSNDFFFAGEPGRGPGVQREFFQKAGAEAVSPDVGLFMPAANGRCYRAAFHFEECNGNSRERLRRQYFLGRLMGVAISRNYTMPIPLSNLYVKEVLEWGTECRNASPRLSSYSTPLSSDVPVIPDFNYERAYENEDPDGYKQLMKLRDPAPQGQIKHLNTTPATPTGDLGDDMSNAQSSHINATQYDINGVISNTISNIEDLYLTFEVTIDDASGSRKNFPLKEGGGDIDVTNKNKEEYIAARMKYLVSPNPLTRTAVEELRKGLFSEVPWACLKVFSCDEFSLLLNGVCKLDVNEWRKHTNALLFDDHLQLLEWFWEVVNSLSEEEKALLLMFATGSPSLPAGGFASMTGLDGRHGFQLVLNEYAAPTSLPLASTCFNLLRLPLYNSMEDCRRKLLIAIRHGSSGFVWS